MTTARSAGRVGLVGGWLTAALVGCLLIAITTSIILRAGGTQGVTTVSDLSQLAFSGSAASTACWAAWRATGRLRSSWALVAAGCAAWTVAQAIWSYYELVLQRSTPFPSVADVGFLLFPVCASIALWTFPVPGTRGDRMRRVLDALTVTAALGLTWWMTALGAVAHQRADSPFAFVVSLSYPVLDLTAIAIAVNVLSRTPRDRSAITLLTAGVAAIAVADSAFVYLTARHEYASGALTDLGWIVGFALLTLAPLVNRGAVDTAAPASTRRRSASKLPYLPVLLAVIVVTAQAADQHRFDVVDKVLVAVIVVLVMIRQYTVLHENSQLVHALSEREDQLLHQAFHDALTGLANRALFRNRLAHALDLHRRDLRAVAVMFCDLDDFKLINDTLGHAAGDELLVRVAERFRGALRTGDTLARLGGDEFAVLVEDGADPWTVAGQLIDTMRMPYTIAGVDVAVRASLGLTVINGALPPPQADEVLAQADIAMYLAKQDGKGCFRAFEAGMELPESMHGELSRHLAAAIRNREISLAYQPIVDLQTGRLSGFEALARWRHGGTDITPDTFVALAESSALIGGLTQLVLDTACRQLADWDAVGGRTDFTVALNICPTQAMDSNFPDQVLAALDRHQVAPERLVLEITESTLITDLTASATVGDRLTGHGITLSLDDFGVGYSSLTHLSAVPLTSLKIDRSFVSDIDTDPAAGRLLRALLRFGADLGLTVIAEGIERATQRDLLIEWGCQAGQGYLLGRPAPAATWTSHIMSDQKLRLPKPRTETPGTRESPTLPGVAT